MWLFSIIRRPYRPINCVQMVWSGCVRLWSNNKSVSGPEGQLWRTSGRHKRTASDQWRNIGWWSVYWSFSIIYIFLFTVLKQFSNYLKHDKVLFLHEICRIVYTSWLKNYPSIILILILQLIYEINKCINLIWSLPKRILLIQKFIQTTFSCSSILISATHF